MSGRSGGGCAPDIIWGGLGIGIVVALAIAAQPGWQQGLQGFFGGQPPASGAPGTWTGTLDYSTSTQASTQVSDASGSSSSTSEGTYTATVGIQSSTGDSGTWTLSGDAKVESTLDVELKTTAGDCTSRVDDQGRASGQAPAEGSLQVTDGFYELSLTLPGFEGTLVQVRDESGCSGELLTYYDVWPVTSIGVGGSGMMSNSNSIMSSKTEPILNADGSKAGETVTKWSLTFNP